MNKVTKYLKELDSLHGVSGDEKQVSDYMIKTLKPIVDEIQTDELGNLFFIKKGSHPDYKIMISAHMDEIGFVINYIDETGFIHIGPVGIHDPRMVINQVVNINTEENKIVKGVTGSKPSHLLSIEEINKTIPIEEIFIDVGTSSKQETLDLGINIGDYVSYDRKGVFLNNDRIFTGKSIDNRAGCAVLLQLLNELKNVEIVPTIYAVATIQEEIGIRGAGPAAFSIQPNIALALDVTFAGGMPNSPEKAMPIKMGAGPGIKFFDWSLKTFNGNAVPRKLTKSLIRVAEQHNIPYQREVITGGATDGAKISLAGKGVLTGGVSIPMRYMHTAVGTVDLNDLDYTVSLLKNVLMDSRIEEICK